MSVESASPPLFIGKPKGQGGSQNTKKPITWILYKGKMGRLEEYHGWAPPWPANLMGGPKGGSLVPKFFQKPFGKSPKRWLSIKQPKKHFHYSWKHFSTTVKSENISVGLRTILVPTKMILDAFQNNFGLVIFICEKQTKRFRQLRNISGFFLQKIPELPRTILAPSKNFQACAKTNLA